MPLTPSSKLSLAQKALLLDLLHYYRTWKSDQVPVRRLRGSVRGWTGAESASFSRTLRRLEQRGLIVRTNQSTGIRTDPLLSGRIRTSAGQPFDNRTDRQVAETVK